MLNELLTLLANSIMLPERWHPIFILGCNILMLYVGSGLAAADSGTHTG
jgi:hypothetical protein